MTCDTTPGSEVNSSGARTKSEARTWSVDARRSQRGPTTWWTASKLACAGNACNLPRLSITIANLLGGCTPPRGPWRTTSQFASMKNDERFSHRDECGWIEWGTLELEFYNFSSIVPRHRLLPDRLTDRPTDRPVIGGLTDRANQGPRHLVANDPRVVSAIIW